MRKSRGNDDREITIAVRATVHRSLQNDLAGADLSTLHRISDHRSTRCSLRRYQNAANERPRAVLHWDRATIAFNEDQRQNSTRPSEQSED